ncbi:Secretory carrier-associated membrane 1 [Micractinium conductrix]|uniref:Secretory carrier-associated membrane protein n=1 Tax=Micractinium conductrix TaxID=554055 RepID=A0A2P6VEQ6_9CHLO|nr:Secretory carrier-associated membrane 1 [Micractinium conductrix]|eukprot:PSC72574.1 Secretory carrier-associated membrane 1 [Micractinium conductrix]
MAQDNPFSADNPFATSTVNGTVPAAGGAWGSNGGGAWGGGGAADYAAPPPADIAVSSGGGGGGSKAAGRKEADLSKREAELNKREAELRRLELEIRNNPGAKSTKNWPRFCPVLHHDIAGEIPAQSQVPVRRAYWAYLGLIWCLFFNFVGATALLITDGKAIASWLWASIWMVGGIPGAYFMWYSRLYNAAIKDSAFGYAMFFAGFFANLAFSVWSAVGPPFLAEKSHTGYISAINRMNDNTGVGIVYFIGAAFWTLESMWSLWVYKLVYRAFRGQGMSAAQAAAQPPAAAGVHQQAGDINHSPSTKRKLSSAAVRADLVAHIRGLAETCGAVPDICKRRAPGEPDPTAGIQVADWDELRQRKDLDLLQAFPAPGLHPSTFVPTSQMAPAADAAAAAAAQLPLPVAMVPAGGGGGPLEPSLLQRCLAGSGAGSGTLPAAEPQPRPGVRTVGKVTKANKQKAGGRTFTSKYRGVHQTFPTRRWEAQFRRNGKPTSLGCFDHEEQAARAYDKMMLWCELHNAAGVKGGITNFDQSDYEADMGFLGSCTQDELVQLLRSDGRRQAAQRMLKQKRDGAALYHGESDED